MLLGICGYSNSGKTTLIERIIKEMKDVKIGVVKHAKEVDVPGKDSSRFIKAGASEVVLINNLVHIIKRVNLYKIVKEMNYDLILLEGFKSYKWIPKICLGDAECENCIMRNPEFSDVMKYIKRESEIEKIMKNLPNFNCGECDHRNCREMAEAIYRGEDKYENCRYWNPDAMIEVRVNDKDIYMGKFAQDVVIKTISGMLSAFKGVKEIKDVEIRINLRR